MLMRGGTRGRRHWQWASNGLRVMEKQGGKSGHWQADQTPAGHV